MVGAWLDVDTEGFRDNLCICHGQEAVRHVMRVACGLDSMVLGEPQVLGQLKGSLFAGVWRRFHGHDPLAAV